MIFLFLFISINVVFLLYSILNSRLSFFEQFINGFFLDFIGLFTQYIEVSVVLVAVVFFKKYLIRQKYSLTSTQSWKITIKVYSEIVVETLLLLSAILLVAFISAGRQGVSLIEQVDAFAQGQNLAYLMILVFPLFCLFGTFLNVILLYSALTPEQREPVSGNVKNQLRFAGLLSVLLPLFYSVTVIITPGGLKLFFDVIRSLFKTG